MFSSVVEKVTVVVPYVNARGVIYYLFSLVIRYARSQTTQAVATTATAVSCKYCQ